MTLYSAALFVHVVGAVLLFAALTLEGVALRLLRRASTGMQASSWAGLLRLNRGIGPRSAVASLDPRAHPGAGMSTPATRLDARPRTAAQPQPAERRWTALAFIALAQLMIALDATIMSIALPSAQGSLHASDADRQWVITAYTL